jgi:hypothetical protein
MRKSERSEARLTRILHLGTKQEKEEREGSAAWLETGRRKDEWMSLDQHDTQESDVSSPGEEAIEDRSDSLSERRIPKRLKLAVEGTGRSRWWSVGDSDGDGDCIVGREGEASQDRQERERGTGDYHPPIRTAGTMQNIPIHESQEIALNVRRVFPAMMMIAAMRVKTTVHVAWFVIVFKAMEKASTVDMDD